MTGRQHPLPDTFVQQLGVQGILESTHKITKVKLIRTSATSPNNSHFNEGAMLFESNIIDSFFATGTMLDKNTSPPCV